MFGKSANQNACSTIDTLIGAKTEIKGDIHFSGGLRIDGKVKGSIIASGEGPSTLVISEQAAIQGNVSVPHVVVNGKVQGNIRSTERLELQPNAEVAGDITYKTMEMALGASINGSLIHEADRAAPPKLKAVVGSGAETD